VAFSAAERKRRRQPTKKANLETNKVGSFDWPAVVIVHNHPLQTGIGIGNSLECQVVDDDSY